MVCYSWIYVWGCVSVNVCVCVYVCVAQSKTERFPLTDTNQVQSSFNRVTVELKEPLTCKHKYHQVKQVATAKPCRKQSQLFVCSLLLWQTLLSVWGLGTLFLPRENGLCEDNVSQGLRKANMCSKITPCGGHVFSMHLCCCCLEIVQELGII